jgi:hypothetical protein
MGSREVAAAREQRLAEVQNGGEIADYRVTSLGGLERQVGLAHGAGDNQASREKLVVRPGNSEAGQQEEHRYSLG